MSSTRRSPVEAPAATRYFQSDPERRAPKDAPVVPPARPEVDRRDGEVYESDERIDLAVNVAIATGRPLLLRGPTGCGKSSLAPFVARQLGWRYCERVVTSRTQARDLLYGFDAVRRLNDAQAQALEDDLEHYVEPGVLWWAFDPPSAEVRGARGALARTIPRAQPPADAAGEGPAVVLLDEIDKADPDVPNNLLVTLGSLRFRVEETQTPVEASHVPLVFLTTNEERALPDAFLRRCVVLELAAHDEDALVRIAGKHFGPDRRGLYRPLAERVGEARERARHAGTRAPSTAEYLDAIRACLDLGIEVDPEAHDWRTLFEIAIQKPAEE